MRREKTYRLKKKNFVIFVMGCLIVLLVFTNMFTKHVLIETKKEKVITDATSMNHDNKVNVEDSKEEIKESK